MKVKELIERLLELEPDYEVRFELLDHARLSLALFCQAGPVGEVVIVLEEEKA